MPVQILDKNELITSVGDAIQQLEGCMASLEEDEVNKVPYEDSWTAGQLFRHVAKSINGIAGALTMEGKQAGRDAAEKIPELKKNFLDFSIKMKSPEFIIPEVGPYNKQAIDGELNESFEHLKLASQNANLTHLIENLPLGPVTKLEMLHFVLFHTQRHLNQMYKICNALENSRVKNTSPVQL